MKDIYVVVADNDREIKMPNGSKFSDPDGPLIFEQYVRTAGLENIKKRKEQLETRYGRCRIAKLTFIDEG